MEYLPHWIWAILAAQFFITLALTHMLYELRPLKSYGLFYPYTALGGVIGGILCAVVFPLIFSTEIEIHLITIILIGLFAHYLFKSFAYPITILFLVISVLIFGIPITKNILPKERELNLRSIYGALTVLAGEQQLHLLHGPIQHGSQFTSPEKSLTPTTYYTESGSVGMLIRRLQKQRESIHIGVVGLGTGTLAAYLRPQDTITFWEIDPLSEKVATEVFSFLDETLGTVEIIIQDGRLGVSNFTEELDLLVVDAFSGDGVPMHLLTKEALEAYAAKTKDGLVALHVTNQHLRIGRVAQSTVEALGYDSLAVISAPTQETMKAVNATGSIYMFYMEASDGSLFAALKTQLTNDKRQDEFFFDQAPDPTLFWTDDHHAVWPIIKWSDLLK